MYTADALNKLISLNWLLAETRQTAPESSRSLLMLKQIETLRNDLPRPLLSYHDRLAKQGRASAVEIRGNSCPACHLTLPKYMQHEMHMPGRQSVCPQCGVIIWTKLAEGDPEPQAASATLAVDASA